MSGSVAVIAGQNATGKSRALDLLQAQLPAGTVSIRVHELCEWIRKTYDDRPDLIDSQTEYEPLELTPAELSALTSVVGRRYDEVTWFSIEIDGSPFEALVDSPVMPLMQVKYDENQYDSAEMGLGELSAHLVLWILKYLDKSPPTVILLDEPDAFMPDQSSESLAAEVLSWAHGVGAAVVVTTHSHGLATVAARHGALHILSRTSGQTSCLNGDDAKRSLSGMYGSASPRTSVTAFCEDEAGHYLAAELLRVQDEPLPIDPVWLKGTGALDQGRKILPSQLGRFLYIYDGDQRTRIVATPGSGIIFLPQAESPDALFRVYAGSQLGSLARAIGADPGAVQLRAEALEGAEDHDWTAGILSLAVDRSLGLQVLAALTVKLLPSADKQAFGADVKAALKLSA